MTTPITVSNDSVVADTFNRANPTAFSEPQPVVVSDKTNSLSGFFQDRVSISPQAQERNLAEQQINESEPNSSNNNDSNNEDDENTTSDEFIQVSSSIGRAASSGNLNREEALAIYQKIAALI